MTGKGPERIGRAYYEESGYFTGGGEHLLREDSAFHRYRIREVLRGCGSVAGKRVLDLGCGWGTISFALARAGAARVIGVDFADASIAICNARLGREPMEGLTFLRGDATDTGLGGGEWDLVVAADLIEHLYAEDTHSLYREARRLLRPGGRLILWTPNPGHALERLRFAGLLRADPTHVDYKTLDRIGQEVAAAGFRVERAEYRPSHLPGLRWAERAFQSLVPVLRRRILVTAERWG